jgi:hypothetical protein
MRHDLLAAVIALSFGAGIPGCKTTPNASPASGGAPTAAPSTTGATAPDRKAARSANRQGMSRYRAKNYSGAATAFRAAITADPSYVVAH